MITHKAIRDSTLSGPVPFWFTKIDAELLREAETLREKLGQTKTGFLKSALQTYIQTVKDKNENQKTR